MNNKVQDNAEKEPTYPHSSSEVIFPDQRYIWWVYNSLKIGDDIFLLIVPNNPNLRGRDAWATVEKIEYFAKGMDPYITYKYYIDKSLWLYETGLISLDSLLDEPNFRITRKGIGSTVKKDVTSILKEPQNSEPRSKQGETSWLLWISSDYVLQLITHLKNKNPWVSRSYVEMLIERLRNHEIDVTDLEQKMSQIQN